MHLVINGATQEGCQKAVDCPIKDRDALVAFYDFPPEYWLHLRTINPIESTSATVRGTPLASISANSGFHSGRSVTSPSLAPFDDQGYPFPLIVLSANRMKLGPGGGSRCKK
ncbi:hypothetical protein [Bradyrhizobium sp. AZCC 1693]|uniref:hypothetical protein n=1 Tax=Bradyrhizobium sp. AZCC 1693 TaxID=3117029 RepID=UPI002FF4114C